MASLHFIVFYFSVLTFCSLHISVAPYTLTQSQHLRDGQTLLSRGGSFKLGFFSPSTDSKSRYLGIWYNTIPGQTVVWVANRESPLLDASGILKIGSDGNLVIENKTTGSLLWSSNASRSAETPILEFQQSGNLVLRDSGDAYSKNYLWQSFDYPGNALLSGMKLGWNLETKMNRRLSSWNNLDDPSPGDFTFGMELDGNPEFVMRKGPRKYYRGGSWNGIQETGSPEVKPSLKFTYEFIHTAEEIYFMYQLVDPSIIWRLVLTQSNGEGHLQRVTWVDRTQSWAYEVSEPRDRCDAYALCGVYSSCDTRNVEVCQCMRGFKPKSPQDWSRSDWSQGCEREVPVNCSVGEGFTTITEIKLPETTRSWVNNSMNFKKCRAKCLRNCSCVAFANSDVRRGGSGCILWFTDLVDMRHISGAGQDLYVKMAASELDSKAGSRDQVMLVVSITTVAGAISLGLGIYYIWKKRNAKGGIKKDEVELPLYSKKDELGLHLYDLAIIRHATNNFSIENKLGKGVFGPVYKGMLEDGEEIAVKRLSKDSVQGVNEFKNEVLLISKLQQWMYDLIKYIQGMLEDGEGIAVKRLSKDSVQGVNEFKNEVLLISKLQHINLVKIVGCCLHEDEKMLVYEYLQNKSLDGLIFDDTKSHLLDWSKRFQIIIGIARGLLYLHHDSRLRIIHRDLKASNILLDTDMVPKISDFGMARIFGGDQTEAITKRVVGTHGYISPEYVLDGRFSVKSDVYSFGVIVLEIICGRRNSGKRFLDNELNLLGYAWKLWSEGKASELVRESMSESCLLEDVSRCVHIGLLCVQQRPEQRPNMSSVVLMLSSETALLPEPQPPIFYREGGTLSREKSSYTDHELRVSNDASITLLDAR